MGQVSLTVRKMRPRSSLTVRLESTINADFPCSSRDICTVDAKIGNLGPSGDLISDFPGMKIKPHIHF